jgi:hypothetical protein
MIVKKKKQKAVMMNHYNNVEIVVRMIIVVVDFIEYSDCIYNYIITEAKNISLAKAFFSYRKFVRLKLLIYSSTSQSILYF